MYYMRLLDVTHSPLSLKNIVLLTKGMQVSSLFTLPSLCNFVLVEVEIETLESSFMPTNIGDAYYHIVAACKQVLELEIPRPYHSLYKMYACSSYITPSNCY